DVTAMVGSWRTHFHIKTFDQRAKMSNLVLIDKQITEHLKQFPIYNTQHQRLCLGDITGVHSSGILSAEELDLVIAKLPDQLSQSVIYPNKNSSTPDKVDLKFGWNVGGGKIGGLDQFWSWPEAVESVEKHVQKDDNVKHILVGVTPEVCGLVLSQKYLDALKISGVFFLETPCLPSGGLRFNRSDIFLKQSDQKYLEALLSLPLTIDITPDLNS
ncbi:MAG: hypothetical protein HY565_00850, partial [Candidatus Kerfeldbacteria bacterium]|nr:hypothetical protein [Candidatus Kerfeldbacteria bacterium]